MKSGEAALYMLFQVIGAIIGSSILYFLVQGYAVNPAGTLTGANVYAESTSTLTAFIAEAVFTFIFVLVVLGVTDEHKGTPTMGGIAIGLTLVLVHIVCIPITGTSVNPARSIAPALFEGGRALSQLWLFIVAPFAGAVLSAAVWKGIAGSSK